MSYFYIAFFVFVVFKILTKKKYKSKPNIFIKGYKIFYADDKNKEAEITSKKLVSHKYNISGKPDYIFRRRNNYIPVELKSGKIGDNEHPRAGDLMQLVAYFIIIEENFGKVPYGKLIYSDSMFIIKNTKKLKKQLIKNTKSMRKMLKTGIGEKEPSFVKCKYCICKGTVCSEN